MALAVDGAHRAPAPSHQLSAVFLDARAFAPKHEHQGFVCFAAACGSLAVNAPPKRQDKREAQLLELQQTLGYGFVDIALLDQALTHVSALSPAGGGDPAVRLKSYQRLEFLGDRVLGLSVASLLYARHGEADEGELSIRLANLVRRESCARVAKALNLGAYVRLGAGEAQSGGRRKEPVLADCCEALIGALYQDGGFAVASAFVARRWQPLMDSQGTMARDAKTRLQEWAQALGWPAPIYEEVLRTGPDHALRFVMRVLVTDGQGLVHSRTGEAASKRASEQAAAQNFLEQQCGALALAGEGEGVGEDGVSSSCGIAAPKSRTLDATP